MKRSRSPIFGEVLEVTSLDELFPRLHDLPSENSRVRMWRGQGDIAWPIHSTAFRRLALRGTPVTDRDLFNYEKRLLRYATHRGYRNANGRELSDQELLGRLRHHGAATRLIDATRSAITALWFACAEQPSAPGALIGVHCHYLGGYEGVAEFRSYDELVAAAKDRDYPVTWEPTAVSPRVAAQHSQFLFSRVASSSAGSLELPRDPAATIVFVLPPALKRDALAVLSEVYDLRIVTLFPDLDGFCAANACSIDIGKMERW